MKVYLREEIQALDRNTIQQTGLSSLVLMENAGQRCTEAILRRFSSIQRYLVVAGRGNNGGDGLVIARALSQLGRHVAVVIVADRKVQLSVDMQHQLKTIDHWSVPVYWNTSLNRVIGDSDRGSTVIIDAIFGTGLDRPAKGVFQDFIQQINQSESPVVSIDIPSGLDADSAFVEWPAVKAELCLILHGPKRCHLFYPAAEHCGHRWVVDISIPSKWSENICTELLDVRQLPPFHRSRATHKYDYGLGLIMGGQSTMPGAVGLASLAAFSSGIGLIKAIVPGVIQKTVQAICPELMTIPLVEENAGWIESLNELVQKKLPNVVLCGPGMGISKSAQSLIIELVQLETPLILDADGLNNLSQIPDFQDMLTVRHGITVLTPHGGEASRLLHVDVQEINRDPIRYAMELSKLTGAYCLLKTSTNILSTPEQRVFISSFGNAGLATAGSGDVLAGILTAMLARIPALPACLTAMALHGLAGDQAAKELHEEAVTASKMIDYMGFAFNAIRYAQQTIASRTHILELD